MTGPADPGPPPGVLAAFGVRGPAVPGPGGQGSSWRAGHLVLKPAPAEDAPTAAWLRAIASRVDHRALRIALPVPAADGSAVVDGWQATELLRGAPPSGRWAERAAVARAFAAAFRDVDPGGLPRRDDVWAVAERFSWDAAGGPGPLGEGPLAARRAPVAARAAAVHGDLAGNVLLDPALPPAVLDLSLYARPVEWSVAVLAVDVVAFEGGPVELLRTISDDSAFDQYLLRALLFRRTTDELQGLPPRAEYDRVESALLGAS